MNTVRNLTFAIAFLALANTANAQAKVTQINAEGLQQILENIGYEPRVEKGTNGDSLCVIKVLRQGVNVELTCSVSPDRTKVWVSAILTNLTEDNQGQADKLLKLLEWNQKIGPSTFQYVGKSQLLLLSRPMDNRNVTPVLFRDLLDRFTDDLFRTEPDWNSRKWVVDVSKTASAR